MALKGSDRYTVEALKQARAVHGRRKPDRKVRPH